MVPTDRHTLISHAWFESENAQTNLDLVEFASADCRQQFFLSAIGHSAISGSCNMRGTRWIRIELVGRTKRSAVPAFCQYAD
ncbi:MAG: hypothetical protein ABJZ55_02965, partial [Fuerstiella sp.]